MTTTKKWLDPNYIKTLRELASMYAESKSIPFCFRGDEATLFSLFMKADAWNVAPDYMIAHSYIDDYQRLGHTGNLFRLVLDNNAQIEKVTITQSGQWEQVTSQFRIVASQGTHKAYEKKWNEAIEGELSVTVTVSFLSNRPDLVKAIKLADVDPSIRALDHTWITSPRKRLESLLLRDICYNELYELVNAYEMASIESETSSYAQTVQKITDSQHAQCEKANVGNQHQIRAESPKEQTTPPQEKKLINYALELQQSAVEAQLISDSVALGTIQEDFVEWVKSLFNGDKKISDNCMKQIEIIYTETREIVVDGDNALLDDELAA